MSYLSILVCHSVQEIYRLQIYSSNWFGYAEGNGDDLGHNIAYSRRIHGFWDEHDDVGPKKKNVVVNQI